jgi:hypothetical protein
VCSVSQLISKFGTEGVRDSLTTKLPFDDEEFDYVHIKDIARGVPESKVRYFVAVALELVT